MRGSAILGQIDEHFLFGLGKLTIRLYRLVRLIIRLELEEQGRISNSKHEAAYDSLALGFVLLLICVLVEDNPVDASRQREIT
jgi:hypothetical protein